MLYSDPFTSYIQFKLQFKFSIYNKSSYISIHFNFKDDPTGRGRDTIEMLFKLLDIYLGSRQEYYHFLSELL